MIKRWYYSASYWRLGDVMMANITFLSFLLFSICHSIHVAVNTWLNCRFYINFYISKMAVSRHPGFCRTTNSAIRSADPENPSYLVSFCYIATIPCLWWNKDLYIKNRTCGGSGSDAPFACEIFKIIHLKTILTLKPGSLKMKVHGTIRYSTYHFIFVFLNICLYL